MSRSDEEGFHPHPGDPWHPKWEGEDDEDVDPFAPEPADPEPEDDRPKKRGLFGRKKQRSEPEPASDDSFGGEEDEFPEPSGWEAYDDEMVAADLESVVSDEFPSWTDEGGSSVVFESAFTVGGDVAPDTTEEREDVADDDLGLVLPGLVAEEPEGSTEDAPTELLEGIVLPEIPSVPDLFGDSEDPVEDPTDPSGEDIKTLDDLLPASREEQSSADQGILEIPESDRDVDLTRAAEDAAAALRSRAAEVRREDALEMVADELGGTEVEGSSDVDHPLSSGHQDSLLSAGMDLEEDGAEPTDPEFTPELDEADIDDSHGVPADDVATALESLSDDPAGFDSDAELPPPLVAAMAEDDLPDDADPTEIVSPEAVDAALSAIASEPVASADPDALDALRSIGEGDDVDDWAAFAEGEAAFPGLSGVDEVDPATSLVPPPIPDAADILSAEDVETPGQPPVSRRGLFGRRKGRPEAAEAEDSGTEALGEDDLDEGAPTAETMVSRDGGDEDRDDWQEALEPSPEAVGDTPGEGGLDEALVQSDEDWADDAMGSDDAADAFFSAAAEPKRGLFGGRRARKAAEAAAIAAAAEAVETDDDRTAGWGTGEQEFSDGPETPGHEIDHPLADVFTPVPFEEGSGEVSPESTGEQPIANVEEEYIPVPVLDGLDDEDDAWEQEYAEADAPPSAPVEEPMADMPLIAEADDRIEVTPIDTESDASSAPASAGETGFDTEDEPTEWRGEGSSVPASWFAHVDEDEAVVEDMQPADLDEEAPLLEAGGMFDVEDILDPVVTPEPVDASPLQAPSVIEEPAPLAEPEADTSELADEYESQSGEIAPPPPARDDGGPDFLGAATALIPGGDEESPEPTLWDETIEMDATDIPEPPTLPGGDAEAWDAPPLVPGHDWEAEHGSGESFMPTPPIDPTAEVYDVVEDDLDSAPSPRPAVVDPDAPVVWSEDIYAGAGTMEHRDLAEAIAHAATEDRDLQALSAAMPGLDTGVVGFEDVEDLGTDEVYVPPARSDLGARVLTGLILISLLFGSLWVSGGALAAFIGVMLMIGLTEYFTTLRHKGYTPLVIFGYLGAVGALAGTWAWGPIAIPGAILSTTVIVFFFYAFAPRRRDALVNGSLTVMGMAWVTATIAFAMPIIASENYRVLVFALVACTVAMDVGAYGFGRAWGSAQLAPVLSPNKSIEGLAGGVVLTIGVSIAIGFLTDPFDLRSGAALGLVVAITAPLGDLAESMFKRSLGVKDMGAILPGHGGIMDRVDAFLFVIPSVWVLYAFLGYLN